MSHATHILATLLIVAVAAAVWADDSADPSPPPAADATGESSAKTDAKAESTRQPAPPIDAATVDRLAAQLGADEYAVREDAEARLGAMGEGVMPHLDRTLALTDDAEVLARMERVYRKFVPTSKYAGASRQPGFLGVQMQVVSAETEPRLEGRQWGVQITAVVADSPAEKAGMETGDLIILVDGQPFVGDVTTQDFVRRVQRAGAGGNVEVEFLRGQERRKTTVALAGVPGTAEVRPVQGGVIVQNGRVLTVGPANQVSEQDVLDYRWSRWWQAYRRELRAAAAPEKAGPAEAAPSGPDSPAPVKPSQTDPKENP